MCSVQRIKTMQKILQQKQKEKIIPNPQTTIVRMWLCAHRIYGDRNIKAF